MATASKKAPQEIPDLAKDIYHGDTSSISKSGLAKILAKPSDYYAAYLDPERGAERRTSSLVIGDAVHRLALEPHKFREEFMLAAVKTKTTKAFAKAVAENPGKTVLTEGEWDEVFRMADALWKSPGSRVYLDLCGKAEVSFYWTDPETGVRCRCCPDYLTDDSVYAIDLKTTRDGSPGAFRRQADEHLYWLSAAMTLEGIEAVRRVRPSAYVFLMAGNLGVSPFDVMKGIYVVGGKPAFCSQFAIALANTRGPFASRIEFHTEGTGADMVVTAKATVRQSGKEVSASASMRMAQAEGWTKNPKYHSMPEQMLSYKAALFLIRKYAPEILMGMQTDDELREIEQAKRRAPAAIDAMNARSSFITP